MNRPVARPHPQRLHRTIAPASPAPSQRVSELPPHADKIGTWCAMAILALTAMLLHGKTAEELASFGAWGSLAAIAVSMAFDFRHGIQNMVRTDLMALLALYFLTLAEFLVSQAHYNSLAEYDATRTSVLACICGYAGLLVGRHLIPPTRKHPFQQLFIQPVPSSMLFVIFWFCVFLGYLNMLISVKFNVIEMINYFMAPRFFQPWGRGRYGDWKAMLYETAMILYLVPPLGGILLARRKKFPFIQVALVLVAVAFTFFYGFSSGTRNIFQTYLVTFLIGYCFSAGRSQTREILVLAVVSGVMLIVSTRLMLDFRDVGIKEYFKQGLYKEKAHLAEGQSLAVDNNLYSVSRVVEYFPKHHDFTNLEIPYLALIHPIPRVLWPGKPEGMSISPEDIFGANGWTIALSLIGEEYMMHGCLAVFLTSVFFGLCCAWWNLLASPRNSEFGILVYASGFFSAVITMRSISWFSTALLPTLAGLALGYVMLTVHRRAGMRPPAQPARPARVGA